MMVHDQRSSRSQSISSNTSRAPTTTLSSSTESNADQKVTRVKDKIILSNVGTNLSNIADTVWGVAKLSLYAIAAVKVVKLAVDLYKDPLGTVLNIGKYLVTTGISFFKGNEPAVEAITTTVDSGFGGGGGGAW